MKEVGNEERTDEVRDGGVVPVGGDEGGGPEDAAVPIGGDEDEGPEDVIIGRGDEGPDDATILDVEGREDEDGVLGVGGIFFAGVLFVGPSPVTSELNSEPKRRISLADSETEDTEGLIMESQEDL